MDVKERHDLWEAMADLFLDTETRYQIPSLAARCVRSRLTPLEARAIWRYEVTPAVAANLWVVAGEWACWSRQWLVDRIERTRRRRRHPAGPMAAACYYLSAWMIEPTWRAVEQCMLLLGALPADQAAQLAAELSWLARVFFDFFPGAPPPTRSSGELRRRYEETFLPLFEPLVVRNRVTGEALAVCRARVNRALLAPSP